MPAPNTLPDAGGTGKPDIAATAIYPTLARATLFELHANFPNSPFVNILVINQPV